VTADRDRIDDVAPGDVVTFPDSGGAVPAGQYKVVHKARKDAEDTDPSGTLVVTLEGDGGETCDLEMPADQVVRRSLEAKWESAQSPTPQSPTPQEG